MFSWALGQVYAMPPSKRPPPGTHPAAPGSAQETVWKAHPVLGPQAGHSTLQAHSLNSRASAKL